MFSIVFICPYFGNFPKEQFPLWLKSCEYNSSIDWLIFTDDRSNYNYPKNVKVAYMEFDDLKNKIQDKFSFDIRLDEPYKLCDFRPAYGYIFQDYIKGYDYWGYGDISDTIFGNLRKFLTDDNLLQADKIMQLGHMTLFKNNEEVNSRFMLKANKSIPIESILGVRENKYFDELPEYGINYIYMDNNYPIKIIDDMLVDIAPLSSNFKVHQVSKNFEFYAPDNDGRCFLWENGKLYSYSLVDKSFIKQEIGYVHFQLRQMKCKVPISADSFMIVPNKFISVPKVIDINIIKKYTKNNLIHSPYILYKLKCLKRKFKKIKCFLKFKCGNLRK